jgi:hypothetical protein
MLNRVTPPSRAERRALSDALGAALRGPGSGAERSGIGAELHWTAYTEALLLRTAAAQDAWSASLSELSFDERERLERDLRQLGGLVQQLAALRSHRARTLLGLPGGTSVWHDWLQLILTPPDAPATPGRAAQLAALERGFRRDAGQQARPPLDPGASGDAD